MTADRKLNLTYPTIYPIKVFVLNVPNIKDAILIIVAKYMPMMEGILQTSNSKTAKYLCFTINFIAHSETHIESLYIELKNNKYVRVVI